MQQLQQVVENTAAEFSMERSANKALALYKNIRGNEFVHKHGEYNVWTGTLRLIKTEWNVLKAVAGATGAAFNVPFNCRHPSKRIMWRRPLTREF